MEAPWYRSAFGHAYLALYRHRDLSEARLLVSFLARRGLVASPVIDLGCGAGRHLLALAESGCDAIGVDLSEPLLLRARACLHEEGHPVRVARADIRALPVAGASCGTALSLFTTFGYFDEEADERALLAEVYRVLRPGGHYVLDFLNAARVRAEDDRTTVRREGDFEIHEARSVTTDGRRVVKHVRVSGASSGRELARYEERVTLFGEDELRAFVEDAGLETLEVLGDYEGRCFDRATSARVIVIARRP